MNIYDAIMRAAEHIETHPREFNFWSTRQPDHPGCGTAGCALWWVGVFAGVSQENGHRGALAPLGFDVDAGGAGRFYARMTELTPLWEFNAPACATALRLYAEKYHGHEKVRVPDWNALAASRTVSDDVRSQEVAA